MDAAEAHDQLSQVTGCRRSHDELEVLADAVRKLADVASEVVDDDGREIWLSAEEVELDQWTQRLIDATAVVRRLLGGKP